MTKKAFWLLMPIFLFFLTLHQGLDYFFAQRAGLMWCAFGLVSIGIWRRYGWLVALLAAYVGASVIQVVFWHANQFAGMGEFRPIIHRATLLGAFSTLILIAAVWLKPIARELMAKLFLSLGVFICLHFWILSHWWQPEGFLMTPTLAGVYLVFCFPLIRSSAPWLVALFVLTILGSGGHACILALLAYYTGTIWVTEPAWIWKWLGGLLGSLGIVWLWKGTSWIFRDHGRMTVWNGVFDWWKTSGFTHFGTGTGTWYSLVPWIQQQRNLRTDGFYIYAHNEYLEILFTLGIVGLALYLAFWFTAVVRSKANGDYRSTGLLFALAASSLSMFPLRHDTLLFLVMFLLYDVLEKQFKRL